MSMGNRRRADGLAVNRGDRLDVRVRRDNHGRVLLRRRRVLREVARRQRMLILWVVILRRIELLRVVGVGARELRGMVVAAVHVHRHRGMGLRRQIVMVALPPNGRRHVRSWHHGCGGDGCLTVSAGRSRT